MDFDKFGDEKIDAWLRQVEVPDDLKQRLMAIASSTPTDPSITAASKQPPVQTRSGFRSFGLLFLAASLLGLVGLTVGLMLDNTPRETGNRRPNDTRVPSVAETERVTAQLNDTLSSAELLEHAIAQIEIRSMQSQLDQLQTSSVSLAGNREVTALVLAVAGETAHSLGASKDRIDQDMSQIVENFPQTRGAAVAAEFLTQNHQ